MVAAAAFVVFGTQSVFAQNFSWQTQDARLGSVSSTNGVAVADYDLDGDLDVYFVSQKAYSATDARTWNRLFSNRGDGTFTAVSGSAPLSGSNWDGAASPMGYKMGASWGDYDNDGWPDLFLTQLGLNQLLHNNGDGTFTDVTSEAGVAGGATQLSSSALWADIDHDGDLDLYVSNWSDYADGPRDQSNWLYENLGNGQFENISQSSGLADAGATWTTVALDVNNDGLLDLYLANDFGRNKLYLNNGDRTFSEKTTDFAVEDVYHGMGLAIGDCDENGFFDIYLTNITESGFDEEINPLFLNTGQDVFVNRSVEAGVSLAGWGWGTEFFDLENDGDEDLFVVTGFYDPVYPNVLFRNISETGSLTFERISEAVGLADSTTARGLVVYDYDDDGDQDLLISNFLEVPSLYENRMAAGNWIKIKLEGTVSNRNAFGSVVEVLAGGKTYRRYHHGAQYLGQNIVPVHIGLGDSPVIDRITVRWTNGHVDDVEGVAVNQSVLIRETFGLVGGTTSSADVPVHEAFRLRENYPNPFRNSTSFQFSLEGPAEVELRVYNLLGQTVRIMRKTYTSGGDKSLTWQASGHAPGGYVYRIRATNNRTTRIAGGLVILLQ